MNTFTLIHVLISLVGIATGLVVTYGLLKADPMNRWTAVFLVTTVATSVTGFLFPFHGINPPFVFGVLSLVVLIPAILGRYRYRLAGAWRGTYVVGSVIALYLNVFVLVVQSFQKIPALNVLAPTQTEGPFKIAQLVVLLAFIVLGVLAFKKFHPQTGTENDA